jgi:polyisoprenyl-phosphate glycosyltransferase
MDRQRVERLRGLPETGSTSSGERRMLLSVVIPCMNEEEVLREANRRLVAVLEQASLDFEIVHIDDGSTDSTPDLLRELQIHDTRIRVVRFSRNFGHQIAITAGLEHAIGCGRR